MKRIILTCSLALGLVGVVALPDAGASNPKLDQQVAAPALAPVLAPGPGPVIPGWDEVAVTDSPDDLVQVAVNPGEEPNKDYAAWWMGGGCQVSSYGSDYYDNAPAMAVMVTGGSAVPPCTHLEVFMAVYNVGVPQGVHWYQVHQPYGWGWNTDYPGAGPTVGVWYGVAHCCGSITYGGGWRYFGRQIRIDTYDAGKYCEQDTILDNGVVGHWTGAVPPNMACT